MQRSSLRIRTEDLVRIRQLALEMGVSQEKCVAKLVRLVETNMASGTPELQLKQEPQEKMFADLQKIKQLLCRIIVTACPLTDADANDPDFGIGLADVYEDRNKHPEKYGRNN